MRAGTAFVLVVVVLDMLGVGLIIPVAPKLVASFLHGDLRAASRYFGLLFALHSLMQFVFAPVLGGLSDRFGRRPVILLSLLGATASYVISALAPALGFLFVGRTIAGITAASFAAATAYISDVTPPERRAQSFGLIGVALGLGLIVGPVLGGALGGVNIRLPYVVAAGLNLANLGYGLLVLPESLPAAARRRFSLRRANPLGALHNLARRPALLGLLGSLCCTYMAQMILPGVWALHGQSRYGWRPADVGLSLAAIGVAMAVVQGGLVRVLLPRLGEPKALLTGLLMGGLGYLGFGLAERGWMVYAIIAPFSLSAIAGPATQALMSRAVGPSEQGELQGSLTSLSSLAAVFGPLFGTSLLSRYAPLTAHPHVPGAPFFAAAAFNAAGLLLALRLFARRRAASPEAPPLASAVPTRRCG